MLRDASPILKIILLVGFIAMLTFAVWQLFQLRSLQKNGERAEAIIQGYEQKIGNGQSITHSKEVFAPTFSFTTNNGKTITRTSSNFKAEKKYRIGETVVVYYPKDKPLKAKLEGNFPWKLYIGLALLGLAASVIVLSQLIKAHR